MTPTDPVTTPRDPDAPTDRTDKPRVRPISRIRGAANVVFLISGLLFLLGFLLTIALSGTLSIPDMRLLTTATAYVGFIAFVSFLTSFTSILIENRTGENRHKNKDQEEDL
jgi:hypothetical protein